MRGHTFGLSPFPHSENQHNKSNSSVYDDSGYSVPPVKKKQINHSYYSSMISDDPKGDNGKRN